MGVPLNNQEVNSPFNLALHFSSLKIAFLAKTENSVEGTKVKIVPL